MQVPPFDIVDLQMAAQPFETPIEHQRTSATNDPNKQRSYT